MNFIEIEKTDNIYNSLTASNENSFYLDKEIEIIYEKVSIWNELAKFFREFKSILSDSSSFSQAYSALFFDTSTLVESNSSTWLKPITVYYPALFSSDVTQNDILSTITSWVETRYPIFTSDWSEIELQDTYEDYTPTTADITYFTPNMQKPKYVEGQLLNVNVHRWRYGQSILISKYIADRTLCQTQSRTICMHCTERYYGYVYCSNGDFNCSGHGTSCQICKTIKCSYATPPYLPQVTILTDVTTQSQPATYNNVSISNTTVSPYISVIATTVGNILDSLKEYYIKKFNSTVTPTLRALGGALTPRLPSNNEQMYSQISANVDFSFVDRHEYPNILSMQFQVKDCKWNFIKYL